MHSSRPPLGAVSLASPDRYVAVYRTCVTAAYLTLYRGYHACVQLTEIIRCRGSVTREDIADMPTQGHPSAACRPCASLPYAAPPDPAVLSHPLAYAWHTTYSFFLRVANVQHDITWHERCNVTQGAQHMPVVLPPNCSPDAADAPLLGPFRADLGAGPWAGAFELLEGINEIKAREVKPWSRVFTKRMANGTKVRSSPVPHQPHLPPSAKHACAVYCIVRSMHALALLGDPHVWLRRNIGRRAAGEHIVRRAIRESPTKLLGVEPVETPLGCSGRSGAARFSP
jgi:hypothetical protein